MTTESLLGVYLRQTKALTIANLKARYRKTFSGIVWVILNPLIMYGVQSLVFKKFLQLDVPNYALFLLSGLLPWIFITQSLEMCTSILVFSAQLLKAFPVSPLVYIAAQLLVNMINFLAAFFLILIPISIIEPTSHPGLLLLPIQLFILVAGVLGLAWLLATLQVFLRDTRFIVSFGLSISFFLTPIFYPVDMVPPGYRWMVFINPFYRLIAPFRAALYDFELKSFLAATGIAALVAAFFLLSAILVWRKQRNAVYLYL
jgi:ABC-type polysaccharide/polyol phosphate export permease